MAASAFQPSRRGWDRRKAAQDEIYLASGLDRPVEVPPEWDAAFPLAFTSETRKTYQFASENIAAYVNELEMEDRAVLGIAGSGDFPINAYLYGAATVEAVDVSPVACFYSELKVAGVALLDYDEFLGFFATRGWRTFDEASFGYDVYQKLRPLLSSAALEFFDQVITPEGRNPYLDPSGMLVSGTSRLYRVKGMNPYLRGRFRFGEAKRRIRPTLFHPRRIGEFLSDVPEKRYHVVQLSNVHTFNEAAKDLVPLAARAVRPGGQILLYEFVKDQEVKVDRHGCCEYFLEDECWGFRHRVKYALNGLETGSIQIHIFQVGS